jgi:hypothetical protein
MVKTKTGFALLLAALALATTGCLERKETVKIAADGSIDVAATFKGDAGEFDPARADALPRGAPWTVSDRDVPRADGKGSDHVREAAAHFARADDIPATAGDPGDPAPLAAHTSLAIEHEADGTTRWVFERRYDRRDYAWRESLFRKAFPDALRKELEAASSEAGGAPLPRPLVARAVDALLVFERTKAEALLERALGGADGVKAGTEERLAARAAFDRKFVETWRPEGLLAVLDAPAERAKLEERYRAESARDAAHATARAVAPEGNAALEAKLEQAFVRERRVLDVTEALRAHGFEVRVVMPGKVTASDAEAIEDDGRTAVFRFAGEDLCDRDQVLRAVAEGRP